MVELGGEVFEAFEEGWWGGVGVGVVKEEGGDCFVEGVAGGGAFFGGEFGIVFCCGPGLVQFL